MKRGDTVNVPDLGDLLVHSANGDYVKGHWTSGVLKGREACCDKGALLGREPVLEATAPKRRASQGRSREVRDALLAALQEGPVALAPWAQETGFSEAEARGAVGGLRREGHAVSSLGAGKFGFLQAKP